MDGHRGRDTRQGSHHHLPYGSPPARHRDRRCSRPGSINMNKSFYTSYLYGSALNKCQRLLWSEGTADEIERARQTMQAQSSMLKHAQTKIRLLASTRTLDQAQRLRTKLDHLSDVVSEDLSQQEYHLMKAEIRQCREMLIVSAKRSMGLPR